MLCYCWQWQHIYYIFQHNVIINKANSLDHHWWRALTALWLISRQWFCKGNLKFVFVMTCNNLSGETKVRIVFGFWGHRYLVHFLIAKTLVQCWCKSIPEVISMWYYCFTLSLSVHSSMVADIATQKWVSNSKAFPSKLYESYKQRKDKVSLSKESPIAFPESRIWDNFSEQCWLFISFK